MVEKNKNGYYRISAYFFKFATKVTVKIGNLLYGFLISNLCGDGLTSQSQEQIVRHIQNPVKYVMWEVLEKYFTAESCKSLKLARFPKDN